MVGGGDTALEEALYLTKYGKHVHLLVRSKGMRASKTLQARPLHPTAASNETGYLTRRFLPSLSPCLE